MVVSLTFSHSRGLCLSLPPHQIGGDVALLSLSPLSLSLARALALSHSALLSSLLSLSLSPTSRRRLSPSQTRISDRESLWPPLSTANLSEKKQVIELCDVSVNKVSSVVFFTPRQDHKMSRPSALKRKQPDSSSPSESLTEHEKIVYSVIRSKQDMGIWTRDMKKEANLPDNLVGKSIKSLQAKNLIKEVVNVQSKGRKHYMAAEFEPSKELTGGDWYSNGTLDKYYISCVKDGFAKIIYQLKVATLEGISDEVKKSGIFKTSFTKQQIEEILRVLVLDKRVTEVKSTGMGEFGSFPVGKVCYKSTSKGGSKREPKVGAMASIPCGSIEEKDGGWKCDIEIGDSIEREDGRGRSNKKAEVWAILYGLRLASNSNYFPLIVESDSQLVVVLVNASSCDPLLLFSLISCCKALMTGGVCRIEHAFRECNFAADMLASIGSGLDVIARSEVAGVGRKNPRKFRFRNSLFWASLWLEFLI
ncbi:DNA-binding protein [Prunus dulcis]|uniref:DNA-binding protein n=1 Tax=Prunus dulcis TaxID=3755 RepID=A0A4Y1RGD3_PRUDU|nr:DNA-binding protein [Prunus dulcis]